MKKRASRCSQSTVLAPGTLQEPKGIPRDPHGETHKSIVIMSFLGFECQRVFDRKLSIFAQENLGSRLGLWVLGSRFSGAWAPYAHAIASLLLFGASRSRESQQHSAQHLAALVSLVLNERSCAMFFLVYDALTNNICHLAEVRMPS